MPRNVPVLNKQTKPKKKKKNTQTKTFIFTEVKAIDLTLNIISESKSKRFIVLYFTIPGI